MKIVFQFNSKSTGQGVPDALKLAQKCNGILEGKLYRIEFEKPEDRNLKKFLDLVGGLKGSKIYLDEEEVRARVFEYTFYCSDKLLCKGPCHHCRFGNYNIGDFIARHKREIKENVLITTQEWVISNISDFLETIKENHYKINKELFLNYFLESTEFERKYCTKYDEEKLKSLIQKLPDEVKWIDAETYYKMQEEQYREEYEEADIEPKITMGPEFLWEASDIDSKLSFEDILKVRKAVNLIERETTDITVEGTDIRLNYDNNEFVIFKIIQKENPDESEEWSKSLITKKEDLFYAENENNDIYFQLFKEGDPEGKKYFEMLKSI